MLTWFFLGTEKVGMCQRHERKAKFPYFLKLKQQLCIVECHQAWISSLFLSKHFWTQVVSPFDRKVNSLDLRYSRFSDAAKQAFNQVAANGLAE